MTFKDKGPFLAKAALVPLIGFVVFLLVSMALNIQKISKENRQLNQQNLAYMRCLATVFATYTQNGIPVTIENLDTCTVRQADGTTVPVQSLPSSSGSASVTSPSASQGLSPASSSPSVSSQGQSTPNNQTQQDNTSQPDNSQSSSTTPDNRDTVKKIVDFINPFN